MRTEWFKNLGIIIRYDRSNYLIITRVNFFLFFGLVISYDNNKKNKKFKFAK